MPLTLKVASLIPAPFSRRLSTGEKRAQHAFDEMNIDRLHYVGIEARLSRQGSMLLFAVARDRHDAKVVEPVLGPKPARELEAIQARHADVEEHDLRLELIRGIEGEKRVGDRHRFAAHHPEQARKGIRGIGMVIDDEGSGILERHKKSIPGRKPELFSGCARGALVVGQPPRHRHRAVITL